MPIDTLKSKRRLVEEYGLDERQAEGIVELIAQSEERGATASDIEAARRELSLQMEAVEERLLAKIEANTDRIVSAEHRLANQIDTLREELEAKIQASEERLEAKIQASEGHLDTKIGELRLEMERMRRQTLQWMFAVAGFIAVLLTLFEYVL